MMLTGFAGLVAGACSMAIGEFVSVYSQLDIEVAQMRRDSGQNHEPVQANGHEEEKLPNPLQAALASAVAFSAGAMVPLLGPSFIRGYKVGLGVVVACVSIALVAFGWLGAVLGKAQAGQSCLRVLLGGWLTMAVTFGLTKLIA
ncbi:hypothetical protein SAY86_004131 [Trapa natans]|uniref:Vacuolar iron transporter n=1 Tax=Trapa natans TaxID=22666 RepID=A0AAN7MFC7_TRANT|nr:hypothetical protein SAY86_004131 [Trapa natans]